MTDISLTFSPSKNTQSQRLYFIDQFSYLGSYECFGPLSALVIHFWSGVSVYSGTRECLWIQGCYNKAAKCSFQDEISPQDFQSWTINPHWHKAVRIGMGLSHKKMTTQSISEKQLYFCRMIHSHLKSSRQVYPVGYYWVFILTQRGLALHSWVV